MTKTTKQIHEENKHLPSYTIGRIMALMDSPRFKTDKQRIKAIKQAIEEMNQDIRNKIN